MPMSESKAQRRAREAKVSRGEGPNPNPEPLQAPIPSSGLGSARPKPKPPETMTRSEVRHAMTGIGILQGKSMAQAGTEAGFAASTMTAPKRNGITATHCIEQAARLDPGLDPATLLRKIRRLADAKLNFLFTPSGELSKAGKSASLSHVAKMLDIGEHYYGASAETEAELTPRAYVDRMELAGRVMAEYKRRTGKTLGSAQQAEKPPPPELDDTSPTPRVKPDDTGS